MMYFVRDVPPDAGGGGLESAAEGAGVEAAGTIPIDGRPGTVDGTVGERAASIMALKGPKSSAIENFVKLVRKFSGARDLD